MTSSSSIQKLKLIIAVGAALALWLVVILSCTYKLLAYEYTPGADGNFPVKWPQQTGLELAPLEFTLAMAVHPKCSCSGASLGELSKLMARFPKRLHAKVLFIIPRSAGAEWAHSENWRSAEAIPGVQLIQDIDGNFARAFNLETSGATLLYSRTGDLVFSGGITASRGHAGDNAGTQAISDILSESPAATTKTAAFGCHLFNKK